MGERNVKEVQIRSVKMESTCKTCDHSKELSRYLAWCFCYGKTVAKQRKTCEKYEHTKERIEVNDRP